MSTTEKLLTIEDQILQLQEKKKKVEDKRKKDLADLIHRTGALALPDPIIAGILVDMVTKFPIEKKEMERLESLGKAILKPGRGRRKKQKVFDGG